MTDSARTLPISAPARLGEFLRARRLQMTPGESGVAARRRRRAEGLRREEVAARAGISADWYARIELGGGAVPSVPTLQAIAAALNLNALDTRYLFELAGLPVPRVDLEPQSGSLMALQHAIFDLPTTAATIFDLFSSPLSWNALSDALFRWSRFPDAFSRNGIVAGLTDPYYRAFFGDDFVPVARRTIGLFRRAYTTGDPPALARRVYEFGMTQPLFIEMWNENSVADEMSPPGPFFRFVPEVGRLHLDFNDLLPRGRDDVFARVLAPRDAETCEKFTRLAALAAEGTFKASAASDVPAR